MHGPQDFDVITIGEALCLVAPMTRESLRYAREVALDSAGAELNLASHLASLGVRTEWVGRVGEDVLGHRVLDDLSVRGVGARWVELDPAAPTGVYFKDPGAGVLYYRAGSAASLADVDFISSVPLERARIVHLTGITPALSPACSDMIDEVVARVSRSSTLLSFDVNHRAQLWSIRDIDESAAAARLRELADAADVVFVGLDEASIWGVDTPEGVRELLPHPRLLVVKDGGNAAFEFNGRSRVAASALPASPFEVIGAGDAFAAGYLAALLRGDSSLERLHAGHERAVLAMNDTSDFPRSEVIAR